MTAPHDGVARAEKLVVGWNGKGILPPIDLVVHRDELWAVVGKNGGGKTTFLKTLLGLLPRVAGERRFAPGATIGYVPQRAELDPGVPSRVVDVVRGGLDRGWSFLDPRAPFRARPRVQRAMEECGVAALARHPFHALSEGQRQRVLLARALVVEPALLVLDEPTSAMDVAAERAAFDLLAQVQRERRLGIVVVSHHLSLLAARATHVLLVDKDEQLVLGGPIDVVRRQPAFLAHYGADFVAPPPREAAS